MFQLYFGTVHSPTFSKKKNVVGYTVRFDNDTSGNLQEYSMKEIRDAVALYGLTKDQDPSLDQGQDEDDDDDRRSPKTRSPKKNIKSINYPKLIDTAIMSMNDKNGSSEAAIRKFCLKRRPDLKSDEAKSIISTALTMGVKTARYSLKKGGYEMNRKRKMCAY
jgi:linker histone H1 and H5 family